MDFNRLDSIMKEVLELHKNFNCLSVSAKLIVKEYLEKKYIELAEALHDAENSLTSEMEILENLENNLTKK